MQLFADLPHPLAPKIVAQEDLPVGGLQAQHRLTHLLGLLPAFPKPGGRLLWRGQEAVVQRQLQFEGAQVL